MEPIVGGISRPGKGRAFRRGRAVRPRVAERGRPHQPRRGGLAESGVAGTDRPGALGREEISRGGPCTGTRAWDLRAAWSGLRQECGDGAGAVEGSAGGGEMRVTALLGNTPRLAATF